MLNKHDAIQPGLFDVELYNGQPITDGIHAGTEERKQRGADMAKVVRIDRKGDKFLVPSMSGSGRYTVDPVAHTCTCPDHHERGCKCKHQWAVEFSVQRETTVNADGSTTVTDTVAIKATKRTTYSQDWPNYNKAQTNEQDQFRRLLADLCSDIQTPPQTGRGQRRLPLADVVFATVFKVYSTFSGRRFISDLRAAHSDGFISKLPHYNSIFAYLENPELSPILDRLIQESAKPLAAIESDFAADSSGFATSRFVRWFDHKYGVVKQEHDWVKVHIMCGVKTNVITAVEIKDRNASDPNQLPALLETTAQNFKMAEVSCDKGYSTVSNTNEIAKHGATPFIMYKKNANAKGSHGVGYRQKRDVWEKMFHFFSFKQDEFLAHYHKRSNVESTFSMVKAKFGDAVRSKTDVAMKNEALCKLLAHNICCLISAMYELGIDPTFGQAA
jgi:transposase